MPKRKRVVHISRAQILTEEQFGRAIALIKTRDNALRNEVMVRLAFNCALRAQEIAGLQWKRHILDATGAVRPDLKVTSDIAKGTGRVVERDIPITPELADALRALRTAYPRDVYVIPALDGPRNFTDGRQNRSVKGGVHPNTLVKYFKRLFAEIAYEGCTSHSGRRSFITHGARKCGKFDASLRDIQILVGHRKLETTASYIEPSNTQKALVRGLFG